MELEDQEIEYKSEPADNTSSDSKYEYQMREIVKQEETHEDNDESEEEDDAQNFSPSKFLNIGR